MYTIRKWVKECEQIRDGSNCLLYKHEDLSSIAQNPGKKLRMAACDSSPGETETGESCLPATLSYELQVFCFSFKDPGSVPSTQIRKPEDLGLIPTTHMEEGKS